MSTAVVNDNYIIQASNKGERLIFEERVRKNVFFLSARIIDSQLISNLNGDDSDDVIFPISSFNNVEKPNKERPVIIENYDLDEDTSIKKNNLKDDETIQGD